MNIDCFSDNGVREKVLVSIVIPVYNVEKYLDNCIKSVISQTYKNLEIILVNDGSTDTSAQICALYGKKDTRIRIINKNNSGLSDARNAGIDIARGEYITFIDSDDFVLENYIEMLLQLCIENQVELSMCQSIRCSESDTIKRIYIKRIKKRTKILKNEDKLYAYLVTKEIDAVAWKKMYAMHLFDGIRFPSNKLHEDTYIAHILIDRANALAITNEPGYVYRNTSTGIMNREFSLQMLDSIEAKIKLLSYVRRYYPNLVIYAQGGVVYACNYCLKKMALANYYDEKIEWRIKKLYKKNLKGYFYLKNGSIQGKTVALLATISTKFARVMIRLFCKEIKNK